MLGVCNEMAAEVGRIGELLPTELARVRLALLVDVLVRLQVGPRGEELSTDVARVLAFSMGHANMAGKALLRGEAFPAHRTTMIGMYSFAVRLEHLFVLKWRPAILTMFCPMRVPDMHRNFSKRPELLPTHLARVDLLNLRKHPAPLVAFFELSKHRVGGIQRMGHRRELLVSWFLLHNTGSSM